MAKSQDAFRTISEASEEVAVAQHVLRFWETKFTFLRPMKRTGGRRFYRPRDIALLITVKRLLHDEGLSIKEVQALHRRTGLRSVTSDGVVEVDHSPADETTVRLQDALASLETARGRLSRLLANC